MDDVFTRYQSALRAGHQLAAQGRFKDALGQYQDAAAVAGERALPHVYVGSMLVRLGKPKEALLAYDRALAVDPADLDALGGRAAALLAAGRRADALAVQQQIAALRESPRPSSAPAGPLTPLTRAETLAVAGEQALEAGDSAGAIDAWLDEAREHAAERHFDAAFDAALRALALDGGSTRVHVELARIYAQRGWAAEAAGHLASLRQLLDLAPDAQALAAVDELTAVAPPPPT